MSAAICSASTRNCVLKPGRDGEGRSRGDELRRRLARFFEMPGLFLDHHDVGQPKAGTARVIGSERSNRLFGAAGQPVGVAEHAEIAKRDGSGFSAKAFSIWPIASAAWPQQVRTNPRKPARRAGWGRAWLPCGQRLPPPRSATSAAGCRCALRWASGLFGIDRQRPLDIAFRLPQRGLAVFARPAVARVERSARSPSMALSAAEPGSRASAFSQQRRA